MFFYLNRWVEISGLKFEDYRCFNGCFFFGQSSIMVVFSKWDIVYMYYLVCSGIIIWVKVEE